MAVNRRRPQAPFNTHASLERRVRLEPAKRLMVRGSHVGSPNTQHSPLAIAIFPRWPPPSQIATEANHLFLSN